MPCSEDSGNFRVQKHPIPGAPWARRVHTTFPVFVGHVDHGMDVCYTQGQWAEIVPPLGLELTTVPDCLFQTLPGVHCKPNWRQFMSPLLGS